MSGQWHYSQDGAQYGPVDETEIIRLIQDGELAPGTPVCKAGGKDWQPARNHDCFQVEIFPTGNVSPEPDLNREEDVDTSQNLPPVIQDATNATSSPGGIAPTRPTCVLVWGILITIYGCLGCCAVPSLFVQDAFSNPEIEMETQRTLKKWGAAPPGKEKAYMDWGRSMQFIMFPFTMYGIIVGIGLLASKPWSRQHTIYYGAALIIIGFVLTLAGIIRFGISWWGLINYAGAIYVLLIYAVMYWCICHMKRQDVVLYFESRQKTNSTHL